MDLSALADFHRVAAAGSLGKATRASGRPKATLARHVRQLEESLHVRLFERGGHMPQLTAEGRTLYERTHGLLREIEDVGGHLASGSDTPRGLLRISAPALFANTLGGRLVAEFAMRFPEVRVDLVTSDHAVDLVDEGFDLAIRVNPAPDSDLVGRCFAHDAMLIVAPPALALPDAPDVDAPVAVTAVTLSRLLDVAVWQFEHAGQWHHLEPDYRVRLSSLMMVRDAVCAGAGAAVLPRSLVRDELRRGRMVQWGSYSDRKVELWVLHTSRRLVSAKVSAFVAYLADAFPSRRL